MTLFLTIVAWIIPTILAITIHEAAHAWMANYLGDHTAKQLGRLSFNPIRHIDPIGTILIPIFVGFASHFQFIFGWAKPVPINNRMFKSPRRDEALVAAAGPSVNIFMAILWVSCLKLSLAFADQESNLGQFLLLSTQVGVLINLMLAFINLIPIPPLDGSRILASILPAKYASLYMKIEPYGFIILLVLLLSQGLRLIIEPPLLWTYHFLQSLI